jgi:hypothetical protein
VAAARPDAIVHQMTATPWRTPANPTSSTRTAGSRSPFVQIGGVVEPHELNGQPGAIIRDRDGKVISSWALDILDGRIQTIRSVIG